MKILSSMSKGRASMAAAFAAVLCLAACNKENTPADPEPSAEIKNQIEYSEEPLISIKSVIYEAGADNSYSFYLSPTEGITNIAGMQKAADYLFVKTTSVKGEVNTETENFEVSYKDITAKKGAMDGIRKAALSVNLLSKTSVEISADVITAERKPLFVRYNGACAKALSDLSNQVELNQETTTTIASSTAWRYNLDGESVYSLYEQSNVSKPADATPVLTISISDDADIDNITDLDLSAVSANDIAISYGDIVLGAGRKGTLTMSTNEEETELSVLMDATIGDNRIRVTYTGIPANGYYSSDKLTIKSAAGNVEKSLPVLFRQKDGANYVFAFGTNDKAAAAADLASGDYAVKMTIPASAFDEDGEANADFTTAKAELYYYPAYATLTSEKAEGEVSIETVPGAKDGKIYFYVTAALASGETLTAEYYGVPVDGEIPDLTPVKPVEPKILITDESGKELQNITVTAMEVMRNSKFYDASAAEPMDAYVFYFRNEKTGEKVTKFDSNTPYFVLAADKLGSEDLDLNASGTKWAFYFTNNTNLYLQQSYMYNGYGSAYTQYGMDFLRCPDDVKVTVKKDGKEWYFKFVMKDWGNYTSLMTYMPDYAGTKNTITIEWKGAATKYSGTQDTNEMKDEDY